MQFELMWDAHGNPRSMLLAAQHSDSNTVTLWANIPHGLRGLFADFTIAREKDLPSRATFVCGDADAFLAQFAHEDSVE